MRLIDTKTMQLEDFTVREVPEYAILSHTWTEEEVTFQDITGQDDAFIKKVGFGKILKTCVIARANNIRYAWVDTCCIDKTSSAELTEAINSMFLWYKNASICYAFLSDLPQSRGVRKSGNQIAESHATISYDELRACRWFTRGWTLQELIAPKIVEFYDEKWTFRGTKADFADDIHKFTHIDSLVLRGGGQLTKLSIAERMTWASRRKTTRIEDTAYCLLGIFDINMPLLYGEGEKAFTRLQEEIIKNNSDLSIFGWSPDQSAAAAGSLGPRTQTVIRVDYHAGFSDGCEVDCGHGVSSEGSFYSVLASSPDEFVTPSDWDILGSTEHSVTNRGIKIHCSLLEICLGGCDFYECRCCPDQRKYVLVIGRTKTTFFQANHENRWGIVLDKIGPDAFVRCRKRLILLNKDTKLFVSETRHRAIYLLTQAPHSTEPSTYLPLRIREGIHFIIDSATPEYRWNSSTRSWYIESDSPHEWGMVSLEVSPLGKRVSILFTGSSGTAYVLDPSIYAKEIGHISQSPSILTSHDVRNVFGPDALRRNSNKLSAGDEELTVVARVGNPLSENWVVEVWIEEREMSEGPNKPAATSKLPSVKPPSKQSVGKSAKTTPESSSQTLPAVTAPLAPNTSQWAASASAATHNPSGSIQAVIVRCSMDQRNHEFWSATRIRSDHPVFTRPVLPIPALIEIPMVMHRLGTQSRDVSDLENRVATWLNIEPGSGFAPAIWQDNVGTVIVARKDRKPLLTQHLEAVWDYCGRILDAFGDGDGAPTRMYNRAAFEKWWRRYSDRYTDAQLRAKEEAEAEGVESKGEEDDWLSLKSPYEV